MHCMLFQKLSVDFDKTWWMSWVGVNNKPIRFEVRMQIQALNGIQNVNCSA